MSISHKSDENVGKENQYEQCKHSKHNEIDPIIVVNIFDEVSKQVDSEVLCPHDLVFLGARVPADHELFKVDEVLYGEEGDDDYDETGENSTDGSLDYLHENPHVSPYL